MNELPPLATSLIEIPNGYWEREDRTRYPTRVLIHVKFNPLLWVVMTNVWFHYREGQAYHMGYR